MTAAGIHPDDAYGRRGRVDAIDAQMAAALELLPVSAQADVRRSSAGIVDVTPDASPILGLTPIEGPFDGAPIDEHGAAGVAH